MNIYKLKYATKEAAEKDLKAKGVYVVTEEGLTYATGIHAVVEIGKIITTDGTYDEEGNLIDLCYSSKIGSEDHFFQSIAPFVKEGSYINWSGEDNSMWQWYFNGKEMVTRSAHITWSE